MSPVTGTCRCVLKRVLTVLCAVLVSVFSALGTASAATEVVGGVAYNTYSFDWAELGLKELELNSGFGGFAGVRFRVGDALWIGPEIDYTTGSGQAKFSEPDLDGDLLPESFTLDTDIAAMRCLVAVATELNPRPGIVVTPFAAAGIYGFSLEQTFSYHFSHPPSPDYELVSKFKADNRFGGRLGVSVGMELAKGVRLGATAAYRFASGFTSGEVETKGFGYTVKSKEDGLKGLNISGFSLAGEIAYLF